MIIMGVDPGTRATGYGIIEVADDGALKIIDYGCINAPTDLPLSQRYKIIFTSLTFLLEKHPISHLAVETQFVGKNTQSTMKLCLARGMAVLAATLKDIPVYEYSPTRAKQAVVGNGQATKLQVQKMLQMLLRLSKIPEPEDASDALALAICHLHTFQSPLNTAVPI
ncbi:MAG: Holliday junction resolvase [Chlamydiales bacterium]|jgi:crossover junction endodeoxyribonuclease RuvC|nr:Holliday junction resolvase [Chlamydiales bacterium]